jgi:hypothetical protein
MTSGRICRKLSSIAFILDERTLLNKWALGNRQQATGGNSSSNPPALRAAYAGSGLRAQGSRVLQGFTVSEGELVQYVQAVQPLRSVQNVFRTEARPFKNLKERQNRRSYLLDNG